MKRILVDMDGVLADVYSRFFDLHEQETGIRLSSSDVTGRLESEAFPNQVGWVSAPGFFRNLPAMPGSIEGLKKLNSVFDIVVISLATEFPQSLTDKQLWMQDHFPFISWKQLVFCGNKNLLHADIMIDDHPKNLDHFPGETIIFTQPHNILTADSRHTRVSSWEETENLLLKGPYLNFSPHGKMI
jgi:5'(3')-deoxyribonucleotidase